MPHTAHTVAGPEGLSSTHDEALIGGRYQVTGILGQGGMGTVYAAIDLSSGRRLAVKRTSSSTSPRALELFKREFHTLRGLRHPNIIEVYDFGSDERGHYYTMELLEGSDLGRAAPQPWRTVCRLLRQLAVPLGLLHARRLLHRDISPRNIWVFPDGRLKLIDFGALSPFGVPTDVVGTLPLIAPEWTRSSETIVDQRSDLYSLGALGYWLLTGQHAYRLFSEHDVPHCWDRQPTPPSVVAGRLGTRESVPAELDALILALLQRDKTARPENTERVLDRIDAIAGPTPEPVEHAMRGCLLSRAFVGRSHELQLIRRHLHGVNAHLRAVVIESEPGLGRSRLLEEISILSALSGATHVHVRAERRERKYGVANAIVLGLLERLPVEARAAAEPGAATLAQLSPELRRALDPSGSLAADTSPPGRALMQQALSDWLQALASERQIVILVDDTDRSDEESISWLIALALQARAQRALLVAALAHEPGVQLSLPLEALRRAAQLVRLSPLTPDEVQELVHSVFGTVEYLGRVAHVVAQVSQGSPAHCIELLEYLVDRGLVQYVDGAWLLPGRLPEAELPPARSALQLARLERVSQTALRVAQHLSVQDGPLTRADCMSLSDLDEADTSAALVELALGGLLTQSEAGYTFISKDVRERALSQLPRQRRILAHARLGQALISRASDPVDTLRAAVHLWHAGAIRRCKRLVSGAVQQLLGNYRMQARLPHAVPLLEEVVALYRQAQCGAGVLCVPLTALAAAGYVADPRLARRYGTIALTTLDQLLRLNWARALRRYLGRRAALYLALAAAAMAHPRRIRELILMFILCENALNGVATPNYDFELLGRCAHALEPLAVLGEHDLLGLMWRLTRSVAAILTEHHADTLAELCAVKALLESDARIRYTTQQARRDYVVSFLFPIGVMECWRMNPVALEIADRIAASDTLDTVGADHIRAVYHSMRGERALAEQYKERVEKRALEAGTAWHVVTLGPLDAHFTSLWTRDALLGKHAAAELERLSRELPTLRHEARHARATYLVLCGRYREVIETMRDQDMPKGVMGWTRGQGVLARAHNRLGEYARARELCRAALEGRTEEDLSFVVMNLHVQLELALAEAALGEHACAHERTQQLFARHAERVGPLVLGAIHETGARVALFAADYERARKHCAAMRQCYAPTDSATLLELANQLAEQIARAELPTQALDTTIDMLGDDADLITRTHSSDDHSTREQRARRALYVALELTDASCGIIIPAEPSSDIASLGDLSPGAEVIDWAKALRAGDAELTADMLPDTGHGYIATLRLDAVSYCMFPLELGTPTPPAVLVLGFPTATSCIPDQPVLARLARSLRGMLA